MGAIYSGMPRNDRIGAPILFECAHPRAGGRDLQRYAAN